MQGGGGWASIDLALEELSYSSQHPQKREDLTHVGSVLGKAQADLMSPVLF